MSKNVRDAADASAILNSLRKSTTMSADIAGHIKWIGSTGSKMDATIHAVAVGCIHMSMPLDEDGFLNADPAINLMRAMPKGTRAKALAAWFEAYSNIRVKFDKKAGQWIGSLLKPTMKGYEPADPAAAFQKPFWAVEEAKADPKAFLLGEQLAKLIKLANDPKNYDGMTDDEKKFLRELNQVAVKAPKTTFKPAAVTAEADALENVG